VVCACLSTRLGDRVDHPAIVHDVNVLTVVASESFKEFVTALQKDISDSLSARPKVANEAYFTGKVLKTPTGNVEVTPQLAKQIYKYLLKNDYSDDTDRITGTTTRPRRKAPWHRCPRSCRLMPSRCTS
jgi:type III restriction enzyme